VSCIQRALSALSLNPAADIKQAEPWTLFNPPVREAHFRALRQLADLAKLPVY
jgi:hypothetical protein